MQTTTDIVREFMREERGFHLPKLYPSAAGLKYICPLLGIEVNGGGCKKAEYLKFISMSYPNVLPKREDDIELNMKAAMGELLHEATMKCHRKNGTQIGEEVRFNWPEMLLGGRIDGIVDDKVTHKIRALEIKTKTLYLKGQLIDPDRNGRHMPDVGAVAQALTYYNFFKHKLFGANDDEIKEFVSYKTEGGNKEFCEKSLKVMTHLRDYMEENGVINQLEVFYISRDDFAAASHMLHVYDDGKIAIMNKVFNPPVMLPYNANGVLDFFNVIIGALKDFEGKLDKLRSGKKAGSSSITLDKFLDTVKACAPEDDYVEVYDDERMSLMYKAGLLTSTDEKKFEKGHKLTKHYGDQQCKYCDFREICKGRG